MKLMIFVCLRQLELQNNRLEGEIPFGLTTLVEMTLLDLSNNLLDGDLPFLIGNLQFLTELRLHQNFNFLKVLPILGI